ncbi:MAG: phosphate acyltransferase PlsX [Desulfobacteraceae bacterium]
MKIAVDAMGGDNAPGVVVQGAVDAASESQTQIILVGHEQVVTEALDGRAARLPITVHHCEEMVEMGESPLKALRKKRDASIGVAFDLVKKGKADAVISAGNSGATLAAGVLTLGRMEGVDRPAIASIVPTDTGPVVLIDVGANVDCRPGHLLQFAAMAHAFATVCLGIHDPKVGLLSIGEEGSKGNEQVRLARELFQASRLNFMGNVEGRDIFSGKAQIVVCDGFVGNVALKVTEGVVEAMTRMMDRELSGSFWGHITKAVTGKTLRQIRREFDYEEYGGAPLLGIRGVGMVCHGGSSAKAIKNAVKLTAQYVNSGVLDKMSLQLSAVGDLSAF